MYLNASLQNHDVIKELVSKRKNPLKTSNHWNFPREYTCIDASLDIDWRAEWHGLMYMTEKNVVLLLKTAEFRL